MSKRPAVEVLWLKALQTIAAIPLWGEPIADHPVKREYAESGEYDLEHDEFNPCCDTESTHLRDAVEIARNALNPQHGDEP